MELIETLMRKYDTQINLLINGRNNALADAKKARIERAEEWVQRGYLEDVRAANGYISSLTEVLSDLKQLKKELEAVK